MGLEGVEPPSSGHSDNLKSLEPKIMSRYTTDPSIKFGILLNSSSFNMNIVFLSIKNLSFLAYYGKLKTQDYIHNLLNIYLIASLEKYYTPFTSSSSFPQSPQKKQNNL